jgi:uncharacterized membrane protein YoaK (UPF0700 family)
MAEDGIADDNPAVTGGVGGAGDVASRRSWRAEYLRHPEHGPLPALLLVLTIVSGFIDAVSILALGRVFVANMTGNLVFTGFAIARAPGFVLAASLIALGGFVVGALLGGVAATRLGAHRGLLLRDLVAVETLLFAVATVVVAVAASPPGSGPRDAAIAICALAMGVQNAVVGELRVPDLTTTVMTRTLTSLVAHLRTDPEARIRRLTSVVVLLGGAICGALMVIHSHVTLAMAVATVLAGVVTLGAAGASMRPGEWQHPRS